MLPKVSACAFACAIATVPFSLRQRSAASVVQVYHMPGSSDNFVTAFRTWLNKYGGGGPFGPMNERWLQVSCSSSQPY